MAPDVKGQPVQPPSVQKLCRLTDAQKLRVGGRVGPLLPQVVGPGDHRTLPGQHRAHGHFALPGSLPGFLHRQPHQFFVAHALTLSAASAWF